MLTDLNLLVQYTGILSFIIKTFLYLVWEMNIAEFFNFKNMTLLSGSF